MKPQEFDRNRVIEVVRRNVSDLEIYRDGQRIDSKLIGEGIVWACYAPIPHKDSSLRTSFTLNLEGNVCHLASINLAENLRGKRIGERMYRVVEQIAREMGCDRVRQEPSGWTSSGETRRDYLKRKLGYVDVKSDRLLQIGVGEVEKIL